MPHNDEGTPGKASPQSTAHHEPAEHTAFGTDVQRRSPSGLPLGPTLEDRKRLIMASLKEALSDANQSDRNEVLAWIGERGYLGLARENGPVNAAEWLYRCADVLAGSV